MEENKNNDIPSDCEGGCTTCNKTCSKKNWLRLRETDDYKKLVKFFMDNGLEYNEEDYEGEADTDVVKLFEIVDFEGSLVAALCIALREGKYIIDGIAVTEERREEKLGKLLLDKAVKTVKSLGGDAIYLVARAPGFFKKYGFEIVDQEDAPSFFECKYCSQYKVSCQPEIMKYGIE